MISLQEYLKKYSTISSKFIDDFFSLYDGETNTDDYVINLDILAKWLKSRKDNLKDTLKNSYVKNIDYKIKKGKSTGGRPSEIILLTPECFKRLTMSSKTVKAEEVRTYFIQLEKHIDKYKNYIIDGLGKKVKTLENNQKPKINKKGGVVYILKSTKDIEGIYRIGKTKKFKERKNVHDSSHPDDMEIIMIYETQNIDEVESCLKSILKSKQYRKRKEFYEIDLDVLKELIDGCEKLSLKVKKKPNKMKQKGGFFLMIDKFNHNY
jgi:phage anti-repressor protein